jgi:hypothetical protein
MQEIVFTGPTPEEAERAAHEWLRDQDRVKLIARSTRHKGFGFDSTQHEWTVKLYYEIEQPSE